MRYFFLPATIFFVIYSFGWLVFQSASTVISSPATIWSFVVGGLSGITMWICGWAFWDHLKTKQRKRLDMEQYNSTNRVIDNYVDQVQKAKQQEDVDRLERVFKGAV